MRRQIIDKVNVENETKQNKTKPVFGNRPYKCSDGVENIAETNFHKKNTTCLEIFISKKDIEFQVLKKNLMGRSTNR